MKHLHSADDLERQVAELKRALAVSETHRAAALAQRDAEAATRQRLAAIVEASRDAIWSWNADGIIESWNAEAERVLQYRPDEIIGRSLLSLVPPERAELA